MHGAAAQEPSPSQRLPGSAQGDVIRMPEALADQLKAVAALERTTVQDFCLDAILPRLKTAAEKHHLDHKDDTSS